MKCKFTKKLSLFLILFVLIVGNSWGQVDTYALVNSDTDLEAGASYLLVGYSTTEIYALGKQNANNRSAIQIIVLSDTTIVETASNSADDKPFEVILRGSAGQWTLFDTVNETYLRPRTGANNGLQGQADDESAKWTISISPEGIATMVCENIEAYPRNILRFNDPSKLFACYSTGQKDVYLFKKLPPSTDPNLLVNTFLISNLSYTHENGPSAPQSFQLSGSNLNGSDVVVSAPENFVVSATEEGLFQNSITLTAYDGADTNIFVKLDSGLVVDNYSDTISITGGGASETIVIISGKVVEKFEIPYSNQFQTDEDRETVLIQGFEFYNVYPTSGYSRLDSNSYIQTPQINFNEYESLAIYFSTATYGGFGNQEMQLQISNDGENFETLLSVSPTTTTFIDTLYVADLLDSTTNGYFRFVMSSGTKSLRFKDLTIEETTSYTLTINTIGQGTVNVNGNAYVEPISFVSGAVVNIEAIPDSEYYFENWTGNLSSSNSVESVSIDSNTVLTANFKAIVGVNEGGEVADIKVYPNPFDESINISNLKFADKVILYDILGKVVFSADNKVESINTSNIDNGLYFIEIIIGDNKHILKLVK